MNTEERFKKDIWWLLQEIKKDEMSTARTEYIHFEYANGENKPTVDDQRRAVRLLTVTRAINVHKDVYPFPFDAMTARISGIKPSGHLLELREKTFEKVYELFEWVAKEKADTKTALGLAEFMSAGTKDDAEEKTAHADVQKITPKLAWLDTLSDANLEKFAKVIAITLEELEITGINRLTYNKISITPYQRAGFDFDEVKKIVGKIGIEEGGIITVSNDELKKKISGKEFSFRADNIPTKKDFLETFSLVENDLDTQLIVRIPTLETIDVLKNLRTYIDGKTQKPNSLISSSNKTPKQKQLCVIEKISSEFELGMYSDGMVDMPASDFSDCGVDSYQLSRIMTKFRDEGLINQFFFIDARETKDEAEYDYDVYRLYLPKDFLLRAKKMFKETKNIESPSEASISPEVLAMKNKAQIIKNFNLSKIDNLSSDVKIYLLKVYYSYYENILSAYYGSGLFFVTAGIDDLNDYFKVLRSRIIKIIDSDVTFSKIKNDKPYQAIIEPISSLYSSMDFFDGVWTDFTLPLIIELREEIADKDLFENSSEIHKTDLATCMFFEAIANEIEKLKTFQNQQEKKFYEKDIPRYKKDFEGVFGEKNNQTIKHEHLHRFNNSIQEKEIVLNHKFEGDNKIGLYITQKDDDFYYKGQYLKLSKKSDYYKVFCSLFAKLPNGGEISYQELTKEIQSRIPKTKGKNDEEMRKFIQSNLTDKSNGFVRYAKMPATEDNGKALIETMRGAGITFNNKQG